MEKRDADARPPPQKVDAYRCMATTLQHSAPLPLCLDLRERVRRGATGNSGIRRTIAGAVCRRLLRRRCGWLRRGAGCRPAWVLPRAARSFCMQPADRCPGQQAAAAAGAEPPHACSQRPQHAGSCLCSWCGGCTLAAPVLQGLMRPQRPRRSAAPRWLTGCRCSHVCDDRLL